MTPEQKARLQIDCMLEKSGWLIQDLKQFNPTAGLGVAVREYPTDSGPADYILFINRLPVGVIEAKEENKGELLTTVEDQSARYATSHLKWASQGKTLAFVYESTGAITRFTDNRDPSPRSREVFSFHRPDTLKTWLKEDAPLRRRLRTFPELNQVGLRDCQVRAITNLEKSFTQNRPKALIQMATGSGKTFTAITSVYRLLKFAQAKRVLFLVDTRNLGEQAEQEFQAFRPNDDQRKFTELYTVQRLNSSFVDPASQVCISTIQRMFSILKGEELDESAEQTSLNEIGQVDKPKEVAYNAKVPIEQFDFIVIDECHRSIYNLWKQVLDYFDAFLIGLTATPDSRTFGFFDKNVVSEYTHEQAVADGVNVGYDVYTIETEITQQGSKIVAKEWVDTRDRQTRRQAWLQLDEDLEYRATQLDRDVVNKDQIRTVIRTFREKLTTDIFPDRREVPKTLIFAKTDSHADDIIQIVRAEFGEGNRFCKKVTYGNDEEKPSEVLQQFRTAYYPRVAVTVDMIATGTDVKAIECLLFMRDVKSRNYFEQMKGRGTRTLREDDLRKVTPSAHGNKTHFVIVDAVGVCKTLKTDSRPLERLPTVALKDLMLNVVMGTRDEATLTTLANRLTRLEKQMNDDELRKLAELTGGRPINQVVSSLLDAYNPDVIENTARNQREDPTQSLTPGQREAAKEGLVAAATEVFYQPAFRDYIENVRKNHNQIMDIVNLDTVRSAGWDQQAKDKAGELVQEFSSFVAEHKDQITALQLFYGQPYRRRELTFRMIKELGEFLRQHKPNLAPALVWKAYEQLEKVNGQPPKNELIALVSLVRRVTGIDAQLTAYEQSVNRNFQEWVFRKNAGHKQFTDEQMEWLRMIKDYVASSVHLGKDDFDLSPFGDKGGLAKAWQLFGEEMDGIVEELNEVLAA